ncbi:MAG TPA: hypothetical protein VIN07_05205 [Flavipsychrobacter sp.]
MKKILFLLSVVFMLNNSSLKAQTDLVLTGDPTLCNQVEVYVYAYEACGNKVKSNPFIVTPGSGPTTYNLLNPAYWGVYPAGAWTIEEILVRDDCRTGLTTGSIPCGNYDAAILYTGISCTILTPSTCYETSSGCGGCGAGDLVNINLTVGTDIRVNIN